MKRKRESFRKIGVYSISERERERSIHSILLGKDRQIDGQREREKKAMLHIVFGRKRDRKREREKPLPKHGPRIRSIDRQRQRERKERERERERKRAKREGTRKKYKHKKETIQNLSFQPKLFWAHLQPKNCWIYVFSPFLQLCHQLSYRLNPFQ